MPMRGLLFDLDDTLITTRSAMMTGVVKAVRTLWPQTTPTRAAAAAHRFREDPSGLFVAFTRGHMSFEQMRAERVADLADFLHARLPSEPDRAWAAAYDEHFFAGLAPFGDVAEALTTAHAHGLALGVLTNGSGRYTQEKLAAAGLTGTFEVVITRDTLGVGKPAPEVFHHACRRIGVTPGECAYIGDEFTVDPVGAQDAGLSGLWLRRQGDPATSNDLQAARARGIPTPSSLVEALALVVAAAA